MGGHSRVAAGCAPEKPFPKDARSPSSPSPAASRPAQVTALWAISPEASTLSPSGARASIPFYLLSACQASIPHPTPLDGGLLLTLLWSEDPNLSVQRLAQPGTSTPTSLVGASPWR